MDKTIIYLKNNFKSFLVKDQEVSVLKDINLSIKDGDFSIIFGPSGCGKSTLLHIILGLEKPSSGQAQLFGRNIYSYQEDERSEFRKNNIGMVYQQPNWIKSLSVVENVAFALSLLGIKKQQALNKSRNVLKTVGMLDWADYHPTELSSGQQQKIALARALVTEPKMIIADEPTGNLDYQSGIELMELFKNLNKQGKTIIMVTHNIESLDYAKTIIQMFNGQIVKIYDASVSSIRDIKKSLLNKIEVVEDDKLEQHVVIRYRNRSRFVDHKKWLSSFLQFFTHISFENIKKAFKMLLFNSNQATSFLGLLFVYLVKKIIGRIFRFKFIPLKIKESIKPHIINGLNKVITALEIKADRTISKVDLIDLSIKNMTSRRTRTYITVGGMTIGIATIVFLVSIGYGLEKMVISRVARLEEMRQIDAIPAIASNNKLTDESLAKFKDINGIEKVLPMIGVVGTISYQDSSTDVAVYGVLSNYLKESAIQPSEGGIFSSDSLSINPSPEVGVEGQVAGVSDTKSEISVQPVSGQEIGEVTYAILPNEYVRVRQEPNVAGALLGYTRRVEGTSTATEFWGGRYMSDDGVGSAGTDKNGKNLGKWLKVNVPVWEEKRGDDGSLSYVEKLDESGKQVWENGYVAQLKMVVRQNDVSEFSSQVLGEATGSATLANSLEFIDIIELDETATASATVTQNKVELPKGENREAVVNQALLTVLGINENAVGKTFNLSLIATGDLVDNGAKIESLPTEYTIVGVIPQSNTPLLYVPIKDVRQLGVRSYSQTKLVVDSQQNLSNARRQVEALGFKTTSVVDTVSQIESLFSSLRLLLGVLGVVALSVAALGMLNTLTVSLLERTREVGMMKAIGMKSDEVQDLYLTESMIMGVLGGVGGLALGFIGGEIASVILSAYALARGYGVLDIAFIPIPFVILILSISLIVGVLTGIYPAKRATKISALDALRYE